MFYVYVLRSNITTKHYYGFCANLTVRLKEHNAGRVKFTKPFRPWTIYYFEEFDSKSDAAKREKFFKSIDGYNWLKLNNII